MISRRLFLLTAAALAVTRDAAANDSTVIAYNSYLTPPFVTNNGGLASDFLALLNRQKIAGLHFKLENLSRSKLIKEISANEGEFAGILLFLNPQFIDDNELQRFRWSPPLCIDRNVLVFRQAPPREITGATLRGMVFGGVLDFRYQGLDDLIESKLIRRENSPNDAASFDKLLKGQVDFVQMNRSLYLSLTRDKKTAEPLHVVASPWRPSFTRHIAVGRNNEDLAKVLFAFVKQLSVTPEWKALLAKYELERT